MKTGKKLFSLRIQDGTLKVCPACRSQFDFEFMKEVKIVCCSNDGCCWNDELADFEVMGRYTPPEGWKA